MIMIIPSAILSSRDGCSCLAIVLSGSTERTYLHSTLATSWLSLSRLASSRDICQEGGGGSEGVIW